MPVSTPEILDLLEAYYGLQEPSWPTEPFHFLIWWHCGYPASDTNCSKGWASLVKTIGITPSQLHAASVDTLANTLAPGGMIPLIRSQRIKAIVQQIETRFDGDLAGWLSVNRPSARKTLKTFPGISDPGADRILLFGDIAPLAAVPSGCPHVLARIQHGSEADSYVANYKAAKKEISRDVAEDFSSRKRAYLLLKRHGQALCKPRAPICGICPASLNYAWRIAKQRQVANPVQPD